MRDAHRATFRRVIQDKPVPRDRRYRPRCENLCGRFPTYGSVCRSCLLAFKNGYYLSPAPEQGDCSLPGREEKILLYAERATNKQPLFLEKEDKDGDSEDDR